MTEERLRRIRSLDGLAHLVDHTPLLKLNEFERVEVVDKVPAPVDEFGIPRAETHIEHLFAAIDTKSFVWTGKMDLHHLCTPKSDFNIIRADDDERLGSKFRGIAQNKIEKPRLMHNFGHAVMELPGCPPDEVMRQALHEVNQGIQLMTVINNYFGKETPQFEAIDKAKIMCLNALRSKIEKLTEPQVNMMPSLETLSDMDFDTLQAAVKSIVSVRRFGNSRLVHPAIRKNSRSVRHQVRLVA